MGRMILMTASLIALAACTQQDQPQDQAQGNAATAAPTDATAALHAAAADPRLAHFYESQNWHTVWTAQTEADLMRALGTAEQHALDKDAFVHPIEAAREPAAHDAALTLAALTFAEALAHGRTDPARIRAHYTVPRPGADVAAGLATAIAHGNVAQWIAGLAPQDAEYRLLSQAYVQYNHQAAAALAQPEGSPARRAAAVPIERARTLAVNLERRRWLERTPPATRIDVNTAATMLTYWRDGQAADTRRVIAGEVGRETPELGSPLYRLVANPTWTVPHSIQDEVSSPAYMARHHMEMHNGFVVQEPGPTNSLGLVKFDLQNDQQIYLHDTPAKGVFSRPDRHASHGCVRVFDALGFAQMLATDAGVLDAWNAARATGDETFVPLPHPIPVRLMYMTAYVENGRIVFVRDAYGWDEDVAEALGLAARPRQTGPGTPVNDLGP